MLSLLTSRALKAILLITACMVSSLSSAAELGSMFIYSKVNQPFSAMIEVFDLPSISVPQLQIKLLSEQGYKSFGKQYAPYLDGLKLELERSNDKRGILRISSQQNFTSGDIHLLVEMSFWRDSQLQRQVREYTGVLRTSVNKESKNQKNKNFRYSEIEYTEQAASPKPATKNQQLAEQAAPPKPAIKNQQAAEQAAPPKPATKNQQAAEQTASPKPATKNQQAAEQGGLAKNQNQQAPPAKLFVVANKKKSERAKLIAEQQLTNAELAKATIANSKTQPLERADTNKQQIEKSNQKLEPAESMIGSRAEANKLRNKLANLDKQVKGLEKVFSLRSEQLKIMQQSYAQRDNKPATSYLPQQPAKVKDSLINRIFITIENEPIFWILALILVIIALSMLGYLLWLATRPANKPRASSGQVTSRAQRTVVAINKPQQDSVAELQKTDEAQQSDTNASKSIKQLGLTDKAQTLENSNVEELKKADTEADKSIKVVKPLNSQQQKNQNDNHYSTPVPETIEPSTTITEHPTEAMGDRETKLSLDLALAYIKMAEYKEAQVLLKRVIKDGIASEVKQAQLLLKKIDKLHKN